MRRLVVLAVVAAVAFAFALAELAEPSERDCSVPDGADPQYALDLEGPFSGHDGHPTYRLEVTDEGRLVDPSLVCMVSFPGGFAVVVDDDRRAHVHLERGRDRRVSSAPGGESP